jgi:DNA primase
MILYQIYCPKNEIRFYSVVEPYYLMGFEDLPIFGHSVVITSSYKDRNQLDKIKIAAVAPVGETTGIKRDDIERLFKRFDNVFVNYNNDEAGIKAAAELLKKFSDFPLKAIFTNNGKDPTEVVKKTDSKELLKQFLDYGVKQF